MLDPLTAISLAGTIVQFVDYGTKILVNANELYNSLSGITDTDKQLDIVNSSLLKLTTKLSRPLKTDEPLTEDEQALADLSNQCCLVAADMAERLGKLKLTGTGKSRKFESLQKAVKGLWKKNEINALVTRLETFKSTINLRILANLRYAYSLWFDEVAESCRNNLLTMSSDVSSRFDRLDEQTQAIVSALSKSPSSENQPEDNSLEGLHRLDAKIVALSQLLNRTEVVLLDAQKQGTIVNIQSSSSAIEDDAATLVDEEVIHEKEREYSVRRDAEEGLLDTLRFATMDDRHDEVAEAHRTTFEWIFEEDSSDKTSSWDNFSTWLKSDEKIYWINGKAGSGKSTLMKFIYHHPKTIEGLSAWSPTAHMAGFFFWNSGSEEQRSHVGLLRSLIAHFLELNRALIPMIFPTQWAFNYTEALQGPSRRFMAIKWTYSQLMECFQRIICQDQIPLRVCIFIDGLDEYNDDKLKIAKFVTDLAVSPKLRFCVSSRPLLEFEDCFEDCPSLRLQDLTLNDIQKYASDTLASHHRYKYLIETDPSKAPELVEEIKLKADGVFLWVKLVVKSLLDGLGNRDTVLDLKRRLDTLPGDLQALYSHMLSKLDKFYLPHASRLFQIVRAAQEERETIGPRDDVVRPLTALALSLSLDEDPDLYRKIPTTPMSEQVINERCQLMADRLKSHSAGLLEVDKVFVKARRKTTVQTAPMIEGKVQYLHRTVRDYLTQESVWEAQLEHTKGTDFNPHVALMRACVIQIKAIISPWLYADLYQAAVSCVAQAYHAEQTTKDGNISLLNELNRIMDAKTTMGNWASYSAAPYESFMTMAVAFGLCLYVRANYGKGLHSDDSRPLLDFIVNNTSSDFSLPANSAEMVCICIQYGKKHNRRFNDLEAVWETAIFSKGKKGLLAMHQMQRTHDARSPRHSLIRLAIVEAMVKNGADLNLVGTTPSGQLQTPLVAIREAFSDVLPQQTEALLLLMKDLGAKEYRPDSRYIRFKKLFVH